MDKTGRPHIIDFGVARLTDSETTRLTMATEAGQLVGTLTYVSPEQVTGKAANPGKGMTLLGLAARRGDRRDAAAARQSPGATSMHERHEKTGPASKAQTGPASGGH